MKTFAISYTRGEPQFEPFTVRARTHRDAAWKAAKKINKNRKVTCMREPGDVRTDGTWRGWLVTGHATLHHEFIGPRYHVAKLSPTKAMKRTATLYQQLQSAVALHIQPLLLAHGVKLAHGKIAERVTIIPDGIYWEGWFVARFDALQELDAEALAPEIARAVASYTLDR